MPPKKRDLEGGGHGGPPSPVFKKRCRSFDLEIRGCRHLQELAASCVQSVHIRLEAALESAVTRITQDVTKALTSLLSRAPRTLSDQNRPPRYKLSFMNGLDNEIYTKKVICATDGEPLKICITVNDQQGTDPHHLHSAKIKVVVLDGDFDRHNQECWTSQEFKDSIVQTRDKVGAILTGVSELKLKNGEAYLHGATFIDNSKFVRSGKFRLGVMVDENLGERVLEGITEPFIVKDRRGEGCKKHEVPLLNDDVWRLKKISKDGVFHEALRGAGIFSVQDLLRFYYKDEPALHKILIKATELVWTTIVEHAKKCDPGRELYSFVVEGNNVMLFFNSVYQIVGATFGDNYTPFSDLDDTGKDLVRQWIKGAYKNMTFDQPDYEIHNAKPRPINQDMLQGLSVLENKLADLMQGQRHIAEEERNVCPTVDEQGTSGSNSKPCTLQRLGSVRVTQNGEDESFDISFYLDSGSEQYCASTSVDDITGSVTLCCPTTAANEITGSVVLKQASLTKDREVYATHLTDNDASVTQLCEEQQQMQAHFGASICAVRALADCPIYSRHSSFKEEGCHEMPALGAEPAV
ncbi:hypothetical protein ACP70R_023912 [Stipagrostis hirtigluma subsp. patula]